MPEADDYTPEAYDKYLTPEVLLPNMGEMMKAKVIGRKRDADGNPIGVQNATQSWIHVSIKLSSWMELLMYLWQTQLLKACIHRWTVRDTRTL